MGSERRGEGSGDGGTKSPKTAFVLEKNGNLVWQLEKSKMFNFLKICFLGNSVSFQRIWIAQVSKFQIQIYYYNFKRISCSPATFTGKVTTRTKVHFKELTCAPLYSTGFRIDVGRENQIDLTQLISFWQTVHKSDLGHIKKFRPDKIIPMQENTVLQRIYHLLDCQNI